MKQNVFSVIYNEILMVAQRPNADHALLVFKVSRSHTTTHHNRQDSSGRVINPSQRPLRYNTQHSQQKHIYVPCEIRTRNLSRLEAADQSLRFLTDFVFEPFKHEIKSHLLSAGIIRSSPYSPL